MRGRGQKGVWLRPGLLCFPLPLPLRPLSGGVVLPPGRFPGARPEVPVLLAAVGPDVAAAVSGQLRGRGRRRVRV